MDFALHGASAPLSQRPGSGRMESHKSMVVGRNPITGAEISYKEYPHRAADNYYGDNAYHDMSARGDGRQSAYDRPDSVPKLNLGRLAADEDRMVNIPDPYDYELDTPDTSSTVSWGTPVGSSARPMYQQYQHQGYSSHQQQQAHQQQMQSNQAAPEIPPAASKVQEKPKKEKKTSRKYVLTVREGVKEGVQHSKPSAWDRAPVPENLPPPSERYREQYKQYELEMKESYRQQLGKQKGHAEEVLVNKAVADMREKQSKKAPKPIEEDNELLAQWTKNPYTAMKHTKLVDKEEFENIKMREKLMETVLADQLSRAVISEPDQGMSTSRPRAHHPGMPRGSIRTLHDSKIRTSKTAMENLLSKRVGFGARIISRDGRDAIRELTGFFFAVDNTLTIYEFRQFGKSAKALPFIARGAYCHLAGRKKGQPYTLCDITVGNSLHFSTSRQTTLPQNIHLQSTVIFKITDVDEKLKEQILCHGVRSSEVPAEMERLHMPGTKKELQDQLVLAEIQEFTRGKLKKRGIKTVTGLGRCLRRQDTSGEGLLDIYTLEKALTDYHLPLPPEILDKLWEAVDPAGEGVVDYSLFMRSVLGEMSEHRKKLVRKVLLMTHDLEPETKKKSDANGSVQVLMLMAFQKLDANKKGMVTLSDIRKFYNASRHPKARTGECSEQEVLRTFLEAFEGTQVKEEVQYVEFEDYYEGLSIGIDSDDNFTNVLKNSWGI